MPDYNWKNCTEVKVRYSNGSYCVHGSLLDAIRWTNGGVIKARCQDGSFRRWNEGDPYYPKLCVILDDLDLPFPEWAVAEAIEQAEAEYNNRIRRRWVRSPIPYEFRHGPVAFTGGRGRRRWRYDPRFAEIRENWFLDHHDEDAREHNIKSRCARNDVDCDWDFNCYHHHHRSWKAYRHTQWR